jgi:glycosyltransferase involved in cell wall biosynthesis
MAEAKKIRLNVHALTFGGQNCASTRFRIIEFVGLLAKQDIDLTWSEAAAAWPSDLGQKDVVILQKKLLPKRDWAELRRLCKKIIYDIDDAIWLPLLGKHHLFTDWKIYRRLKRIVKEADLCLPSNHYIETYLIKLGAFNTHLFPMALDEMRWYRRAQEKSPPVIGWSGAPGNLIFLEGIEPALSRVLVQYPMARLSIFSGKKPDWSLPFDFTPFDPNEEVAAMHHMGVGLLPLSNSNFTRGKSPIKALQYLSAGLPVVASPLDGTRELLDESQACTYAKNHQEWESALKSLISNVDERQAKSLQARRYFESKMTLTVRVQELATLLFKLAS